MNRHLFRISSIAILICFLMVFIDASAVLSSAAADEAGTEDVWIPNEVIVMFNSDAVKDSGMSLKAARRMENVAPDYGSISEAVGEEDKAAEDAKGEVDILAESLGDDFVIEDSMVFDGGSSGDEEVPLGPGEETGEYNGATLLSEAKNAAAAKELTIALVSSEKYDTETMIRKLSDNDMVAVVEPNYCIFLNDNEPYTDYSINDTYSRYLYQNNSPEAENKTGDSVSTRNADTDQSGRYLSINASSGWSNLTGNEEESVVALIDTGVLDTHEDLSAMMWNNDPDKTGLAGVHGYDFYTNTENSGKDDIGHGTHCAGVIAAQANNNKGIAGITSGSNVKIMALKIMGEESSTGIYTAFGAFNYALKARQNGVNVVATSNSWSDSGERSTLFDSIINLLGEQGIITYIAAGNQASDVDRTVHLPLCSESPYTVVVGAAGIDGKPALFSNYGKSTVDVYGPGLNILSTVGYDSYFPTIYPSAQLKETTEYYGEFTEETEIQEDASEYGDAVTPSTGNRSDDSVIPFGRSVFIKQRSSFW